ncbi:unnamed protein product, partial [Phaeothamnion confervicola]
PAVSAAPAAPASGRNLSGIADGDEWSAGVTGDGGGEAGWPDAAGAAAATAALEAGGFGGLIGIYEPGSLIGPGGGDASSGGGGGSGGGGEAGETAAPAVPAKKRRYACSACKGLDHNLRTCPLRRHDVD